jgi:hypothetical protein
MNAQEIFYILGSVAFGIGILILAVLIIVIIIIKGQINRLTTRLNKISGEVEGLVETGKRYTGMLGKGFFTTVIVKLIRSFFRRK